ncbi:MAG TPA: FAD-binding protein, partial [Chthoniobacterales bacterium]|nr:FAD-binding protein [Chthoniobacterales bacterium]
VFLDISWIKNKLPNAEEHIRRKLPSMYHQFKALGDIDITQTPMEVGPTTHYIMGGVHVNPDTQMSTVPGLFAAGECASGINGANRLGGNSLSDLLVFGKRAGEYAAQYAKENSLGEIDPAVLEEAAKEALRPFQNEAGENPYSVQRELQDVMQHNVGIVRDESEMQAALEHLKTFWERSRHVGVIGTRDFNPGWHTALDLKNLLTVSEAITRSAIERKESRGAQFREDYPEKSAEFAKVSTIVQKGGNGEMQVRREPIPEMREDLRAVIEEMG